MSGERDVSGEQHEQVDWCVDASEGARLFNERLFFECHDVWEEIWITKAGAERTFYQGLIQIAVGLYKIDVDNQSGARSLLRKGIDKLEGVPHLVSPVDVDRLLRESKTVLAAVEELGQGRLRELDRTLIPTLWRRDGRVAGAASRDETDAASDDAIRNVAERQQPE